MGPMIPEDQKIYNLNYDDVRGDVKFSKVIQILNFHSFSTEIKETDARNKLYFNTNHVNVCLYLRLIQLGKEP